MGLLLPVSRHCIKGDAGFSCRGDGHGLPVRLFRFFCSVETTNRSTVGQKPTGT